MLGRAELAFVVMGIAYLQYPILSDQAFYTLMLTATLLNIAVPLTIRWWKPYYVGYKPLPRWMRGDGNFEPDPGLDPEYQLTRAGDGPGDGDTAVPASASGDTQELPPETPVPGRGE
jgi:hypothetical protein